MIENKIITEAIEYILLHISDNITLEKVAEHCHMSVSYFSKLFRESTGQSVYAFIKKIKLEQSAMKLKMEIDRSITDIGEDYGYSASNYSSAFSQYHKQSPSEFRNKVHKDSEEFKKLYDAVNKKIRIETKPDYLVTYERTIGNYSELENAWCRFMDKYKNCVNNAIFFERTFNDPTITDKDKCIFDICMSIDNADNYKNTCILKGGKFAVYTFKGYLEQIYPINQQIVGVWFPESHHEIDERYAYDQYHVVKEDGYMEFDICIPIK
ncbi:MAG: GyrI-like domain-containing protein [Lachnotalea sp.]